MQLEEEERIVSLHVKARGQLLSINSHNLYAGEVHLNNGIPQTSSVDKNIHGFGIKSMLMIVEKHGGTMTFNTENQTFTVNILFPLPDAPAEETRPAHEN